MHSRIVVAPPMWLDRLMAFRYPPYDVKNKSKIGVKNKLGFKRGEGLADQRIKTLSKWYPWWKMLLVAVAITWAVDKSLVQGRMGLAGAVQRLQDYVRRLV